MDRKNRNALIAAACILLGFGLFAYYLPVIMLTVGKYSAVAAGAVGVFFVATFFLIFWLRGRSQNKTR
jgi:hypothetical protein